MVNEGKGGIMFTPISYHAIFNTVILPFSASIRLTLPSETDTI